MRLGYLFLLDCVCIGGLTNTNTTYKLTLVYLCLAKLHKNVWALGTFQNSLTSKINLKQRFEEIAATKESDNRTIGAARDHRNIKSNH